MKKLFLLLIIASSALINVGCQAQESDNSKTDNQITVARAEPGTMKNISAEEFKNLVDNLDGLQVLDVRTPGEWAEGTLANVSKINVNDANFAKKAGGLDKNAPIAVYCKMGGRSTRAGNILVKEGFEEVYNLTGGITAWKGAGYEVKK